MFKHDLVFRGDGCLQKWQSKHFQLSDHWLFCLFPELSFSLSALTSLNGGGRVEYWLDRALAKGSLRDSLSCMAVSPVECFAHLKCA